MFWCGFSCKKVRYRTSNFAKKCGTGAVKMTKSAVMERQKYSVLTTYIRQVTSPCLAFLRATGDATVDDTGLGRLTTNISINYSISKTVKQINWFWYKGRRVYYTSNYTKLSVWSHDLSRDSCRNYSATTHACRITRPNMQREKESGIKWDQVGSSGINFYCVGAVWSDFEVMVWYDANFCLWCDFL